jgi:hypothetical protein
MIMERISIAACLFVVACGSEQDSTPDAEAESEPTAYEEMKFEQRHALMQNVVLPQMKEIFVAFDAKFEGMNCATCHGDGATDGTFVMPNPKLPVLPGSEEAFGEYMLDPEHARWSQFMIDQVWPQMASLLKVAKFDPATGIDGFSCHNCHTLEGVPH